MNDNQLEFLVFCIESIAIELNQNASIIYKLLTKNSDILYQYILPLYDILHTQSKEYIVRDILGIMKKIGVI